MKQKWASVRARIAKTKVVGGHWDGLNPVMVRRLYTSQIRPIIEFGVTTIPYNSKILAQLEDMQSEALRILMGFYRYIKYETMLVLSGLCRMRCRVAQLKLCFYNKLKFFGSDLYLTKILHASFAGKHKNGFNADIVRVHKDWRSHPVFVDKIDRYLDLQIYEEHKDYKKACRSSLEECDLNSCLEKIRSSNSGQGFRVYGYCSNNTRVKICPLLTIAPRRRRQRTLFINALSGCDFITPTNYRRKPKCKFCDTEECDWEHLLFRCPARHDAGRALVVRYRKVLEKLADPEITKSRATISASRNSLVLLLRLWNNHSYLELTQFSFGI